MRIYSETNYGQALNDTLSVISNSVELINCGCVDSVCNENGDIDTKATFGKIITKAIHNVANTRTANDNNSKTVTYATVSRNITKGMKFGSIYEFHNAFVDFFNQGNNMHNHISNCLLNNRHSIDSSKVLTELNAIQNNIAI